MVAHMRRKFGLKKIGHTGTLDPLATGVLVLCLGSFTRLSQFATSVAKRYRATLVLGVETDTFDADGRVVAQQADRVPQNVEDVGQVVASFQGAIAQVPPMYSAIKVGGRKLYDLARQGQTVERPSRTVEIHSIGIVGFEPPHLHIDVHCSKGTYIRSLAADIGQKLGCGAHLSALCRTAVGDVDLSFCAAIQALDARQGAKALAPYLLPVDRVLPGMPRVALDVDLADRFAHGNVVSGISLPENPEVLVVDETGAVLGVARRAQPSALQPVCVLARAKTHTDGSENA